MNGKENNGLSTKAGTGSPGVISREQQLEILFNTSNDIIFLIAVEEGPRYKFSSVNPAFLSAIRLQKDQVEGKYVDQVIPEPNLGVALENYRLAISERRSVQWNDVSNNPEVETAWTVTITPVFDEQDDCCMLVGAVQNITEQVKAEYEKARVNYLLNERIKELTTLYTVSQILQSKTRNVDAVLQNIVSILAFGWQYPPITEACIIVGEKRYQTPGFDQKVDSLSASFLANNNQLGMIEVGYTEKKPAETEGPFLAEERKLINMLSEMFTGYFASKRASEQLIKEKELSESIINSLPGIFYLFDNTGKYLRWNKNHELVPGYSTEEMHAMHPLKFFDEDEKEMLKEKIEMVFRDGYADVEANFMGSDGVKTPYYFNGIAIEYEGKPCLMGVGLDITERKKAAEQLLKEKELLQKSEANLQTIFDNTDTIYVLLDNNLQLISYNQRAVGFVRNELGTNLGLKRDFINYFPEDRRPELGNRMKRVLTGDTINYESSYVQTDGSVNWYYVRMFPITSHEKKILGMMLAVSDITEKKLLEQEITNQKIQEQKRITRAVLIAQEKERNKIGQELHDNVNQILVGSKIYLGLLQNNDKDTANLAGQSLGLIDNAIDEIRSLTRDQVTPHLKVDLKELIQSLLDKLNEHLEVNAELVYDISNVVVNDDLKLNIYRIIQECSGNILKHAAAKKVFVAVKKSAKSLHITIADDGKGFDITRKNNGIGLSNILNRVESYNGTMNITSSPGKGCLIELTFPI